MRTRNPSEEPIEPQPGNRSTGAPMPGGERRPYTPPRLHCWGEVRDVTLGGSAGQFDSGNPSLTQPP